MSPSVPARKAKGQESGSQSQLSTAALFELLPDFTGKVLPSTVTCPIHLPWGTIQHAEYLP